MTQEHTQGMIDRELDYTLHRSMHDVGLQNRGISRIAVESATSDMLFQPIAYEGFDASAIEEVVVAKEIGPCGGVQAAVLGAAALAQEAQGMPVYVNVRITNGADSTANLQKMGVVMGVRPEDAPDGSVYAVGAHGNRRDYADAQARGLDVADLTCIFVDTTHKEVEQVASMQAEDGVRTGIIFLSIGGRPDHAEFIGTTQLMQDLGLQYVAVFSTEDIAALFDEGTTTSLNSLGWQRLRIVSQTTNDSDKAAEFAKYIQGQAKVRNLGIDVDTFAYNEHDVCRTVTLRQKAVRMMVTEHDVETLIIIGSGESKNTQSLMKVAIEEASRGHTREGDFGRTPSLRRVIMVNSHLQLPNDISGRVGVVSGASSDADNVTWLLDTIDPDNNRYYIGESDRDRLGKRVFPLVLRERDRERQAGLNESIANLAVQAGLK